MRKLATSQMGNTIQDCQYESWSCQMYQAIKTERASTSTRLKAREIFMLAKVSFREVFLVRMAEIKKPERTLK